MALNLPSLDAAIRAPRPNAKPAKREKKPPTRIRVKAKTGAERDRIVLVRAACVERDGVCRFENYSVAGDNRIGDAAFLLNRDCNGPSEWAHMHARRRSQTRNQTPELRHDTAHSLMLCRAHHLALDSHQLEITPLTKNGCDGPLRFSRKTPKC